MHIWGTKEMTSKATRIQLPPKFSKSTKFSLRYQEGPKLEETKPNQIRKTQEKSNQCERNSKSTSI